MAPAPSPRIVSEAAAILIANATARGAGAVSGRAVVPAFVRKWALPGQTVLDYGAGPQALHTASMRELGLDVTAHDFGRNARVGVHDPTALSRQYDVVLASNVLNTAETEALLTRTLGEIHGAVAPRGVALVNLPASPRKGAWPKNRSTGDAVLEYRLRELFGWVLQLPSGFWACKKPLPVRDESP